jgi:hypothetical protein
MSFPLHAQVIIKKGKYKGMHGVVTQISNGWYRGNHYTVRLDNQVVKSFSKRNLNFTKWDSRI